ncbi:MAG: dihydroorotase [Dokdonia sp.]
MNLLIKAATLIDSQSNYHGQTVDLRIKNGIIVDIDNDLPSHKDEQTIKYDGLHLSQGWFDSSVSMGEPGFEQRETIKNGLEVAAASGFTAVALNPNTLPVLDSSSDIAFVLQKAQNSCSAVYPIGALTRNSESVDLAELYDMQQAGAVAFGDYQIPVSNPNLLKIALQYTQGFDGLVLSFPHQSQIAGKGIVHEGVTSTNLGLKGIPGIAESLQVARDLHILEYVGGKLHIPTISTAASVALIREAKAKGLNVSCSVAIHHLFFTDAVLSDFDTSYKVLPPLRPDTDRQALIEGIKDGTIDMVTSDHNPIDIEGKQVEFDNAGFGTIAQEVTFSALNTLVSAKKAVQLLTAGRSRFVAALPPIDKGVQANLTLFDPRGSWTFSKENILSKSHNAAFIDAKVKGSVFGVLANNKKHLSLS